MEFEFWYRFGNYSPPFLATDSPLFCHLQIYSPLFSQKLKDSPFKMSLFYECICVFDLILLNYLFLEQLECIHKCVILCKILIKTSLTSPYSGSHNNDLTAPPF